MLQDTAEAMAAVGIVIGFCAPVLYGLWRGRKAPAVAFIPGSYIRPWLVAATVVGIAIFVFVELANGESIERAAYLVLLLLMAVAIWCLAIGAAIVGASRLKRRSKQRT